MKKRFPILASILLVVGLLWLLSSIGVMNINIPWTPVILIIIAIGLIVNRFSN